MPDGTCTGDGCDRPVIARKMCTKHYQRWRATATPKDMAKPARPDCNVDGCDEPFMARGWCARHYGAWDRHGDPLAKIGPYGIKHTVKCSRPGCGKQYRAKGLCREHYAEARRVNIEASGPCAIEGCERRPYMRGWCVAHYQRWRAYGDPLEGGPSRRMRGTGLPHDWYSEQRKRKLAPPDAATLEYVEIIRTDPCVYCGARGEHNDHITPVSAGGVNDWMNFARTCARCNQSKQAATVLHFMLRRLNASA